MGTTETNKPWAEKSISMKVRPAVKLAFDAYCQDHGRARSGAAAWLIERFLIEQGYLVAVPKALTHQKPSLPAQPARQSRAPLPARSAA